MFTRSSYRRSHVFDARGWGGGAIIEYAVACATGKPRDLGIGSKYRTWTGIRTPSP